MYERRFYRDGVILPDLLSFEVKVFETDILVFSDKMLKQRTEELVYKYRKEILDYIDKNSSFKSSFAPIDMDDDAPQIIKDMIAKSSLAGVGPMAGIAGAIAEYIGKGLAKESKEVIIENGGDIFIKTDKERSLSIYAGKSPLSGKIGLRILPDKTPLGICTSSGTVGHSKSFGIADAATVIAPSAVLADCVATETGNLVKTQDDLKKAIDYAKSIDGIKGALVILGGKLATWGEIELI